MSKSELLDKLQQRRSIPAIHFPRPEAVSRLATRLFHFLFLTGIESGETSGPAADYEALQLELSNILNGFLSQESAVQQSQIFFEALNTIYDRLLLDANAMLAFDPAATSLGEVLIAYPGFYAIAIHRMAHQLYQQELPGLPRLLAESAHSKTGIDIHPGAVIGDSFSIDHGTGVVIGESATIGNHVKIYQGVTLGALYVAKELSRQKRHPTIEDYVVLYAGATILGGETVIGHNSVIGGNAWLTGSVAPYSVVYSKHEVIVRDSIALPSTINFVI